VILDGGGGSYASAVKRFFSFDIVTLLAPHALFRNPSLPLLPLYQSAYDSQHPVPWLKLSSTL
jgi:hypothetical protein